MDSSQQTQQSSAAVRSSEEKRRQKKRIGIDDFLDIELANREFSSDQQPPLLPPISRNGQNDSGKQQSVSACDKWIRLQRRLAKQYQQFALQQLQKKLEFINAKVPPPSSTASNHQNDMKSKSNAATANSLPPIVAETPNANSNNRISSTPQVILFDDWDVGGTYEAILTVHNSYPVSCRFIQQPDEHPSPVFQVTKYFKPSAGADYSNTEPAHPQTPASRKSASSQRSGVTADAKLAKSRNKELLGQMLVEMDGQGVVAPGLSGQYKVRFKPRQLVDYQYELRVLCRATNDKLQGVYRDSLICVPVIGRRRVPRFPLLPAQLDCGDCRSGFKTVRRWDFSNQGGRGEVVLMPAESLPEIQASIELINAHRKGAASNGGGGDYNSLPSTSRQRFITRKRTVDPFAVFTDRLESGDGHTISLADGQFEVEISDTRFGPLDKLSIYVSVAPPVDCIAPLRVPFLLLWDNLTIHRLELTAQPNLAALVVEQANGEPLESNNFAVDFGAQTNPGLVLSRQVIISNPTKVRFPFCWRSTLDDDSNNGLQAFSVQPDSGVLMPNQRQRFSIQFSPHYVGQHASQFALFIEDESDEYAPFAYSSGRDQATMDKQGVVALQMNVCGACQPYAISAFPPTLGAPQRLALGSSVDCKFQLQVKGILQHSRQYEAHFVCDDGESGRINSRHSGTPVLLFDPPKLRGQLGPTRKQHSLTDPETMIHVKIIGNSTGQWRGRCIIRLLPSTEFEDPNPVNKLELPIAIAVHFPPYQTVTIDRSLVDFGLLEKGSVVTQKIRLTSHLNRSLAWRLNLYSLDDEKADPHDWQHSINNSLREITIQPDYGVLENQGSQEIELHVKALDLARLSEMLSCEVSEIPQWHPRESVLSFGQLKQFQSVSSAELRMQIEKPHLTVHYVDGPPQAVAADDSPTNDADDGRGIKEGLWLTDCFIGTPKSFRFQLRNDSAIDCEFHWIPFTDNIYTDEQKELLTDKSLSIKLTPVGGCLPSGRRTLIQGEIIAHRAIDLPTFLLYGRLVNRGNEEVFSVKLSIKSSGLDTAIFIDPQLELEQLDEESGLIKQETRKFKLINDIHELDFGREVPIFSRVKGVIHLRNNSGVRAAFTVCFKRYPASNQAFTIDDHRNLGFHSSKGSEFINSRSTARQFILTNETYLASGNGVAFVAVPVQGELGPFETVPISVVAFSNMYGDYVDECCIQLGEWQQYTIQLKMRVCGSPVLVNWNCLTGSPEGGIGNRKCLNLGDRTVLKQRSTAEMTELLRGHKLIDLENRSPRPVRINWTARQQQNFDIEQPIRLSIDYNSYLFGRNDDENDGPQLRVQLEANDFRRGDELTTSTSDNHASNQNPIAFSVWPEELILKPFSSGQLHVYFASAETGTVYGTAIGHISIGNGRWFTPADRLELASSSYTEQMWQVAKEAGPLTIHLRGRAINPKLQLEPEKSKLRISCHQTAQQGFWSGRRSMELANRTGAVIGVDFRCVMGDQLKQQRNDGTLSKFDVVVRLKKHQDSWYHVEPHEKFSIDVCYTGALPKTADGRNSSSKHGVLIMKYCNGEQREIPLFLQFLNKVD